MNTNDIVKVNRPGRQMNGWVGRVLEPSPDDNLIWVAFGKGGATFAAPDERTYKKTAHAQHKLLPLSQLSKV
ncbi:hypothetical protein DNI29_04310 [Hymenobacter sediminis]|uniref:hypothetical protein n=1 Tax=Hymenobacter sediminis TaxID=2218621 RepID=UPI000DA6A736|nr:hypothetical protein [Hymenobacter sediminis]RPD50026.1 hypothetical protein DNI29_04310 [Hymenobacter sediminis]